jgi:hypothetical protein
VKTLHFSIIVVLVFCVIGSNDSVIVQGQLLIIPPLWQFKQGTPAQDVKCYPNFHLVLKAEDKSPACVKPEDVNKLIERDWTLNYTNTVSKESLSILTEPGTDEGFYKNGTVTSVWNIDINIDNFKQSNSMLVLQVYADGILDKTVNITPDLIQTDGFYKYKLYEVSNENHFGPYKVVAIYNNEMAVTFAPVFAHP